MSEDHTIYITKDPSGKLAVLPEANFSFKTPIKESGAKTSIPKLEDETSEEYVRWGDDDLEGTNFRQKVEEVPLAGVTIRKQTKMMYGNGLVYYKQKDLQKGNVVERHFDQEIEDFLERNKIRTNWMIAQMQDYNMFLSCFGEFILSRDGESITSIRHIGSEHARKDLEMKNLFYSYYFPESRANDQNWKKIPLIPEYNLEEYLEKNNSKKLAYHSFFPTPGTIHYPRPPWMSLARDKGWLDVSKAVPEIIDSMQRNQVMIKYQINIPLSYFSTRYSDWTAYTDKKKSEVMAQKINDLDGMLSDTNNLYKSVTTIYYDGEISNEKKGLIEIIAIDDKTKEDAWVPSSNASDAQIVQGLEMHPSQLGLAPEGGKMGAGSGSDQRESFNTVISLNTVDQMIVLEPLQLISRFNNWDVVFAIDHTHHTTTNNQESGLEPSKSSVTIKPADNG